MIKITPDCYTKLLFLQKVCSSPAFVRAASTSTNLKEVLAEKIPAEQEKIKEFRKKYGQTKVGEVTLDMVSLLFISV